MKKNTLITAAILFTAACLPESSVEFGPADNVPLLSSCEAKDSISISSATKDGQHLNVVVQHSGGCATHEYAACVQEQEETRIRIIHNANNDGCEALLTETLAIDLGADIEFDEVSVEGSDSLVLR